jgi:hypothetical protein
MMQQDDTIPTRLNGFDELIDLGPAPECVFRPIMNGDSGRT